MTGSLRAEAAGQARYPAWLDGHLPSLDGLRGLAVLLVVCFHTARQFQPAGLVDQVVLAAFRQGWTGVDLFFVLSGFLITGILWRTRGQARYYRAFVVRRALRIFPPYFALLLVFFLLLPAGWGRVFGSSYGWLVDHQAWFWLYAQNWMHAFGEAVPRHTLSHLWSLALEEQFYLFWPWVVLLVPPRRLVWACLLVVCACLAARVVLVARGAGVGLVYASTFTRIDSLVVGCLLAAAVREPLGLGRLRAMAGGVAAACIAALAVLFAIQGDLYGHPWTQTIGFTVIAALYAALLVGSLGDGLVARMLCLAPLRLIGKYSYAMYLFHYPVNALVREGLPIWGIRGASGSVILPALCFLVASFAASLCLALVSWHLLEKWFHRLKDRFQPSPAGAA